MIEIVEYSETNKSFFKALNYEWLLKHFSIEPMDDIVLLNPKAEIIDKGGKVFFAKYNGIIIGTIALIKTDESTYELAKMAVTKSAQGKGIGSELIKHCIEVTKQTGFKNIILYTNEILQPAIYLYRKHGFVEVPFDASNFKRAKIKMELTV